jgi:zinc and cadmium transporter
MTLLAILVGTLAAGIGSVWLAAWLSFGIVSRYTQHMLSLAAGALLATAFLHLLPEAFEAGVEPHNLFMTLLFGLLFFFLLDKAELWHHGHEHHHGDAHHGHDHHEAHAHDHAHSHATDTPHDSDARAKPQAGGWAILAGDSVHCFGDGVLIASAFMVDLKLGVVAALAVLAHEVPHHMGDLVVLRQGSQSRQTAVLKVSLAGAITALGGMVGYALLDQLHGVLPYMLAIASSSFIYVALADLIPQLQKRLSSRETAAQIVWLMSGIVLVSAVSVLAHSFTPH